KSTRWIISPTPIFKARRTRGRRRSSTNYEPSAKLPLRISKSPTRWPPFRLATHWNDIAGPKPPVSLQGGRIFPGVVFLARRPLFISLADLARLAAMISQVRGRNSKKSKQFFPALHLPTSRTGRHRLKWRGRKSRRGSLARKERTRK